MNDLETLRSEFPEQPAPAGAVVTAARRRLADASGTPPKSSFRTHRIGIALTAGTAAVALTALAIPLVNPEHPGAPPGAEAPQVQPVTAHQVLLAAATQQEAESGRYFRVRTFGANRMLKIGTGPSAYTLEQRWVHETWMPANERDRAWHGMRYLGARPATPEDRAKWERDGSPTQWRLKADTESGYRIVKAAPDKGELYSMDEKEAKRYSLGTREGLTADQIRKLPTDPAQLRRFLLRSNGVEGTRTSDETWLFHMASGLLLHMPAPPKVRGAAFRILAGLPDIRNEGTVRDKLGRTGTALSLTERTSDGSFTVTSKLLIDSSGRILTFAITGPKTGEQLIDAIGWTDDTPRIPPVK